MELTQEELTLVALVFGELYEDKNPEIISGISESLDTKEYEHLGLDCAIVESYTDENVFSICTYLLLDKITDYLAEVK